MKKIIIAANWKLNKSPGETRSFFQSFISILETKSELKNRIGSEFEIVFFPPAISLEATSEKLKKSSIKFGGQNIYFESQGAFTGENSAKVINELGGTYALVGHSERRQYFHENDEILNKKIHHALEISMSPMYCVGETLQERENGSTETVLKTQLMQGLKGVVPNQASSLVIAYEPVWAIGTGKIASAEQVSETHSFIKMVLLEMGFTSTPILYGGSVKAANARELISIANVNGFLVGGASLEPSSFLDLISNSI